MLGHRDVTVVLGVNLREMPAITEEEHQTPKK